MKRYLPCLFVLLLLNGCHLLKNKPTAEPLSVMTFNIRYGTANDGENRWELRQPILLDCLQRYHPDLLSVQEALPLQVEAIQKSMPEYGVFGKGRYFGVAIPGRPHESMEGESCRIFFRKGKFDLVREGTFWHSEQPDLPGSTSWGNDLPRIVTWGLFRCRATGKEFVMMNTHFHWGEPYVSRTVDLILKRWRELAGDRPTLFTGDFNLAPTSDAHRRLCSDSSILPNGRYFRDVWQVLSKPEIDAGTGHGFQGVKNEDRIDWVLCTQEFIVQDAQIIYDNRNGRYPSDHYPVLANLRY